MSMKKWCEKLGLNYDKVKYKIYIGESIENVFKKQ